MKEIVTSWEGLLGRVWAALTHIPLRLDLKAETKCLESLMKLDVKAETEGFESLMKLCELNASAGPDICKATLFCRTFRGMQHVAIAMNLLQFWDDKFSTGCHCAKTSSDGKLLALAFRNVDLCRQRV